MGIIETKNISLFYGKSKALKNISLDINKNEVKKFYPLDLTGKFIVIAGIRKSHINYIIAIRRYI